MSKVMLISSDGHATARQEDYLDYLDPEISTDFKEWLEGTGPAYVGINAHPDVDPAVNFDLDVETGLIERRPRQGQPGGLGRTRSESGARILALDQSDENGEDQTGVGQALVAGLVASLIHSIVDYLRRGIRWRREVLR